MPFRRDDMGDSYGAAYTTRSADEGYGERYGEAVKAVLEKKAQKEGNMKEAQRGATSERDASADAGTQIFSRNGCCRPQVFGIQGRSFDA